MRIPFWRMASLLVFSVVCSSSIWAQEATAEILRTDRRNPSPALESIEFLRNCDSPDLRQMPTV